MKVWLVTLGDGSDGDPSQVVAVFATEELAQAYFAQVQELERGRLSPSVRADFARQGLAVGSWDVEEWIVRDSVPEINEWGHPLDEQQPETPER